VKEKGGKISNSDVVLIFEGGTFNFPTLSVWIRFLVASPTETKRPRHIQLPLHDPKLQNTVEDLRARRTFGPPELGPIVLKKKTLQYFPQSKLVGFLDLLASTL
jgi:hypothetical protein